MINSLRNMVMISLTTTADQNDVTFSDPWPTYGYIGLVLIVLIVVVVVLIRKQHRKFNE